MPLETLGFGCFGGCFACFGCTFAYLASFRKPAPKVKESDILAMGSQYKALKLPDGRLLEYSVCGDPDGTPVYYQHGYIASCLVVPEWDKLCQKLKIKLVAASQPGFGLSDVYPNFQKRQLSDWPADVLAVLTNEGIERTHLIGVSAGCVHVAVLALQLPAGMVGNVCFCTPRAPDDVPGMSEGASPVTLFLKQLIPKAYIGDWISAKLAGMDGVKRLSAAPDCRAAIIKGKVEFPEHAQAIVNTMDHAVKFTYRGIIDNTDTVLKPLPFDLGALGERIQGGSAMCVTTSSDDSTNPPVMQEWFKRQIPGCQMMHIEPGWGHMHVMLMANFERMLQFLLTGKDPA